MTRSSKRLGAILVAALALIPASSGAQPPIEQPPIEQAPLESAVPAQPGVDTPDASTQDVQDEQRTRNWGRPVFRAGSDYRLRAGDEVRDVVVISGNASIDGRVYQDVVVILGSARISSTAVINGSLVVIGGKATIASGAVVDRDLVVIGGEVDAPGSFAPGGEHVVIGPAALGGRLEGLVPWITRGLLFGRPIVPDIAWIWSIVALFFLAYLALNLLFNRPVRACANTLAEKPFSAFLTGLLVLLLAGPVFLLLMVSIIGLVVVPFAFCALLVAWILGKVGVARWIGLSVVPEDAEDAATPSSLRMQAIRSFTIGFAILCVAYMIPVLGLLAWATVGVLGLGAAAITFIAGYRRENPVPIRQAAPVVAPIPQLPAEYATAVPPVHPPPPVTPQPISMQTAPETITTPSMASSPLAAGAGASDLASFPHASFRDRLAAFVLDIILVLIAVALLDIAGPRGEQRMFLLLLAYHIGFWTWKGTTVGGIICQLRLVRVDGNPLRFVDALVRGLSSILSLAVLGLGGFWILFDPERQAWHDKVAGTFVVKVPRNYPLT